MNNNVEEFVRRKEQQFLIHSFLYYKLDEAIIIDTTYDNICSELMSYKFSPFLKYPNLIEGLGASGSGYYLQDYPAEIKSKALLLLYWHKRAKGGLQGGLIDFLGQYGFEIKERK